MMESIERKRERPTIGSLEEFDSSYFEQISGSGSWIALDSEGFSNQHYFTVVSNKGDRLGIIGVYDTEDEKHITHTVVDPKYRGMGLASAFKYKLFEKLDLPFITITIDLDNKASLQAVKKLPGVEEISDESYEESYHKKKFKWKPPEGDSAE